MPNKHAFLSPSAAHRWLNCTIAPTLEKNVEDKGSSFAEEGTLAHAYCAKKLKSFLKLPTVEEQKEIKTLDQYHTAEMDEYTDQYRSIVLEKYNAARVITEDAQLLVETRLDFSDFIPKSFGTSDATIIADGTLEIIDFKYGKGVQVSAYENPQMMIYALGAYQKFAFEYHIDNIRTTIIQPRIDNISEYEITVEELLSWGENTLKPKASEAYAGTGRQEPGDWCQFCKVKTSCRALAEKCINTYAKNQDLRFVSKEMMEKEVLPNISIIKAWLSDIDGYALEQALAGVEYKGFKIVEGRSVRKITDSAAVQNALSEAGFEESEFLKPQELKTLTELEKTVGKKQFNDLCNIYIEKPQGKPTLVPITDKREIFNSAAIDFQNINI